MKKLGVEKNTVGKASLVPEKSKAAEQCEGEEQMQQKTMENCLNVLEKAADTDASVNSVSYCLCMIVGCYYYCCCYYCCCSVDWKRTENGTDCLV